MQQPLPLWIGGSSPAAIQRTVRLGTGWLGGVQTPAQVRPGRRRDQGSSAPRPAAPIPEDHFGASFAFRLGPVRRRRSSSRAFAARARAAGVDFDPKAYFALGEAADVLERIAQYRASASRSSC